MTTTDAEAIIADPNNHFPYKRADAEAAGWPEVLASASERVVLAQEAYLLDPSDENLAARNEAEKHAQRLSSEHRNERLKFALERQLEDLNNGNQPAHIGM